MRATFVCVAALSAAVLVTCVAVAAATPKSYPLAFDPSVYTLKSGVVGGDTFTYRAYEGIVYVRRPVDTKYQSLNVYVRTELYEGGTIGGHRLVDAPIWFPNSVGGYMPAPASVPGIGFEGAPNSLVRALARGFVVVAPGARGRTLRDSTGRWTGKAPAVIVDLKAAVRYLRFNDGVMPGDAGRIVSNGTSAGGAVSVLLGASGNHADYEADLRALGAAEARDDVFAVSAYCPITDLDHADMAYEWLLGGLSETKAPEPMPMGAPGTAAGANANGPWGAPASRGAALSAAQKQLSAQLAALFPAYVNGLRLRAGEGPVLTLDADGTGPFLDHVKSLVAASAQAALAGGADLAAQPFVAVTNGRVTGLDWNGFLAHTGRKKAVPAFDALDASSGENDLFGSASIGRRHFTAFGAAHDTVHAARADSRIVRMMNPLNYAGARGARTSRYWRIRHGTIDSDTALPVPVILATVLRDRGFTVDFALPWDVKHSGDYDLDANFDWIDSIAK